MLVDGVQEGNINGIVMMIMDGVTMMEVSIVSRFHKYIYREFKGVCLTGLQKTWDLLSCLY